MELHVVSVMMLAFAIPGKSFARIYNLNYEEKNMITGEESLLHALYYTMNVLASRKTSIKNKPTETFQYNQCRGRHLKGL